MALMNLTAKHPQYGEVSADWTLMRDAYKGERAVKLRGTIYLPPTQAQLIDGLLTSVESLGYKSYVAYRTRARFPMFVREAVQTAIGMMHSQPPEIKLPKAMEKIRSSKGEDIPQLLRRINTEQLITGRIGLMADLPTETTPDNDLPYLTTYTAERIINWDDGTMQGSVPQELNLVVLDESEVERNGLEWTKKDKHRVLVLGSVENVGIQYRMGVFTDSFDLTSDQLKAPNWKGQTLKHVPFVFINSGDITADVDDPPLMDLGNICMTIYRGDADYRQNLFMQGQDTLVTVGGQFDETDTVRTGVGARIDLPLGGKAEYIGVNSQGLSEQRSALERLDSRAGTIGAQTLDSTSRERESGSSLRIRVAARTADMNQLVETSAAGVEAILKMCAEWMNEDPEEVSVKPNKEFGETPITGQDMVEAATAKKNGFPIAAKTMHDMARKRRMTNLTFEEELKLIEEEEGTVLDPIENARKMAEAMPKPTPGPGGGAPGSPPTGQPPAPKPKPPQT